MVVFANFNSKMIDFHAISAEQARSYLDSWLATASEQREWLSKAMVEDGRKPLRDDVDSLQEVGDWLQSRASLREGVVLGGGLPDLSDIDPAQVPSWFGPPAGGWMFDNWTCWAIDAAALNYGHVVTKLDHGIVWTVARERMNGYIDQNRPCLVRRNEPASVPQDSVGVHVGALLRMHTHEHLVSKSIRDALHELGL